MGRAEIFEWVRTVYGTEPEYLWEKDPESAVLRSETTRKWYAIVMNVQRRALGLRGEGTIDIMNVKCDPSLIGSLVQEDGFFLAYHMNKEYWISMLIDGTVCDEKLRSLIDYSRALTSQPLKRKGKGHGSCAPDCDGES